MSSQTYFKTLAARVAQEAPVPGPVLLLSKEKPWPRVRFDEAHFRAWYLSETEFHRRSYESVIIRYFHSFGYIVTFPMANLIGTTQAQLLGAAGALRLVRHGLAGLPFPHYSRLDMAIPYAVRRALSMACADPHKMTAARYDALVAKNTPDVWRADSLVIGANYSFDQLRYDCVHGIHKQFIAFKIVTKDRKGPSYVTSLHTYTYGDELTEPSIDMDHTADCAAGLNVGTLRWCLAQRERGGLYTRASKPDHKILAVRVFMRHDSRVCVPYDTEGKFRVERLEVLGEIDAWSAAFNYMQNPHYDAYNVHRGYDTNSVAWVLG